MVSKMMRAARQVILAVDDEQNVRHALKRTLRKLDAEILLAESGQAGLEILKQQQVDIILSDMRMPGMSGAEFLANAKTIQPACQRILLTGYSDTDSAVRAINEGGICRYLNKPWDDDQLRSTLTEALETARLKSENHRLAAENVIKNEKLEKLNGDLLALNTQLEEAVAKRTEKLLATLNELQASTEIMVDLLANIAALPKPESESTGKKIALALAIGDAVGLGKKQLSDLRRAMRLHRLGWATLPEGLTDKPLTSMNKPELKKFRNHPLLAEALLVGVPQLSEVGLAIANQHENYDGKGFPHGFKGENIPRLAAIIAIARDYFDFRQGRMVLEKMSPVRAVEKIVSGSGSVYCPELVEAFSSVVSTIEKLTDLGGDSLVQVHGLMEGMTLSRDLTTYDGAVLLSKGHVLTHSIIETITRYNRKQEQPLQIHVDAEPASSAHRQTSQFSVGAEAAQPG